MDITLRRSEVYSSSNIFRNSNPNNSLNTSSTFIQHNRGNSNINKQSYINFIG